MAYMLHTTKQQASYTVSSVLTLTSIFIIASTSILNPQYLLMKNAIWHCHCIFFLLGIMSTISNSIRKNKHSPSNMTFFFAIKKFQKKLLTFIRKTGHILKHC